MTAATTATLALDDVGTALAVIAGTDVNVDSIDIGPVLAAGSRSLNNGEVTETANGHGLDSFVGSTGAGDVSITDPDTGDSYLLSHLSVGDVELDETHKGPHSGAPQSVTMNDVSTAQVFLNSTVTNTTIAVNQTATDRYTTIEDYGLSDSTVIKSGMNSTTVANLFGNSDRLTVNEPYTNPSMPTSVYLTAYGQNDTMRFIGGTQDVFLILRFDTGSSGSAFGNAVGGNRFIIEANSNTNLTGGASGDSYSFITGQSGSTTVSGGWNSVIENFNATSDSISLPSDIMSLATFKIGVSHLAHGTQAETTISVAATIGSAASSIVVIGADLTSTSSTVHWT